MTLGACAGGSRSRLSETAWGVYYGHELGVDELSGRELLVLDPAFTSDLEPLHESGVRTLGYLSMGEFDARIYSRSLFRDPAIFLRDNPDWSNTVAMDVRHPEWRSHILELRAPALVARGFNGFFLDTLDMPPFLETQDPVRFAGLRAAAINLVRDLRQAFPDLTILMNRGYALLPEVKPFIDGVVAESLLTKYDFAARTYVWVDETERKFHLDAIAAAKGLPIYSLDYWDPADVATIAKIYRMERALGHRPYVSIVQLDRLVAEPGVHS